MSVRALKMAPGFTYALWYTKSANFSKITRCCWGETAPGCGVHVVGWVDEFELARADLMPTRALISMVEVRML